ncbi:response regulator [Adhaeribacter rhizoryzae]|uniref:Response regulator n=1 Tax=Adhaeribacter rhizoryzae TaxID=2607907 RepID=A0A5M6DQW1_9BACT|nr:response regulator [Adhaeribacter rhizoryzae]KAA5548639.1 response regulator [Adhaeribacter rhizoryzae]
MQLIKEVLLIDDDEISNFLTSSLLKRSGLAQNISICLDGNEAIRLLQQRSGEKNMFPELILLDINMPDMNGFEFLEAFRALRTSAQQPVIAILTTSQNYQDVERLKNFPEVEVFLNKPLYEEDLQFLLSEYFTK